MSLLESCLTAAIVTTTVMIAIPSLTQARETYQLESAARQVAGKMQSARIKAIVRHQSCRVRVNTKVSLVIECKDPTWRTEESFVVPRGFRIAANATPQFHHRGNASPTATVTVWNSRNRSRRVIVNITGRVRVQ